MVEKKCEHCGKKFNVKSHNQKFCSKECRFAKIKCAECGREHKRNNKNPDGGYICDSCHESYIPLVICAECGEKHKKHYKNSDGEYICRVCYITHKCKEIIIKNMQYYNFKNEDNVDLFLSDAKKKYSHSRMYRQLECELLGYGNYNEAMNQAMKRDNYTCQITGKKGNIVAHHLNSYNTHKELACDLDNLITLDSDFHDLYHNICGRGNNTEKQFWEFVKEWGKGLVTLDDFMEE